MAFKGRFVVPAWWRIRLSLYLQCWLPIWIPVQIPAVEILPMQLLAYGLGKQWRMAKFLGLCIHSGHPGGAPASWLQTNSTPSVAAISGVNQQREDFFL